MPKKYLIFLWFIFQTLPTWANMANPLLRGSKTSSPFITDEVRVISETINMTID